MVHSGCLGGCYNESGIENFQSGNPTAFIEELTDRRLRQ